MSTWSHVSILTVGSGHELKYGIFGSTGSGPSVGYYFTYVIFIAPCPNPPPTLIGCLSHLMKQQRAPEFYNPTQLDQDPHPASDWCVSSHSCATHPTYFLFRYYSRRNGRLCLFLRPNCHHIPSSRLCSHHDPPCWIRHVDDVRRSGYRYDSVRHCTTEIL